MKYWECTKHQSLRALLWLTDDWWQLAHFMIWLHFLWISRTLWLLLYLDKTTVPQCIALFGEYRWRHGAETCLTPEEGAAGWNFFGDKAMLGGNRGTGGWAAFVFKIKAFPEEHLCDKGFCIRPHSNRWVTRRRCLHNICCGTARSD